MLVTNSSKGWLSSIYTVHIFAIFVMVKNSSFPWVRDAPSMFFSKNFCFFYFAFLSLDILMKRVLIYKKRVPFFPYFFIYCIMYIIIIMLVLIGWEGETLFKEWLRKYRLHEQNLSKPGGLVKTESWNIPFVSKHSGLKRVTWLNIPRFDKSTQYTSPDSN